MASPLISPGVAGAEVQMQFIDCHTVPPYISRQPVVVLKIIRLWAGEVIKLRCAVVRRGTSIPLSVVDISRIAELSGALPEELMPTPWANTSDNDENIMIIKKAEDTTGRMKEENFRSIGLVLRFNNTTK